jgi:hypothetical protein
MHNYFLKLICKSEYIYIYNFVIVGGIEMAIAIVTILACNGIYK